jgi:hypothetical protein
MSSAWDLDDDAVRANSCATTSADAPEACLSRSATGRSAKACSPIDGDFSPPAAGVMLSPRRHSPSDWSSPQRDHSLTSLRNFAVARCASQRTQISKLSSPWYIEDDVGCARLFDASERSSPRSAPSESPTPATMGSSCWNLTPTRAKMSSAWDLDDDAVRANSCATTSADAPEACLSRSATGRAAKACSPIDGDFSPPAAVGLRGSGQKENDREGKEDTCSLLQLLHQNGLLALKPLPPLIPTGADAAVAPDADGCPTESLAITSTRSKLQAPSSTEAQDGAGQAGGEGAGGEGARRCTSSERSQRSVGRYSTASPVRFRAHAAQFPARSPARLWGIPVHGFGAGARAWKHSPVRVANTPSRSPTRSRQVNIATITKPQQRGERYANQKFPDTIHREMERETQASEALQREMERDTHASRHASPRSEPLAGLKPCQVRNDPTVHAGVGMSGRAGGDRSSLGVQSRTELACDFAELSLIPKFVMSRQISFTSLTANDLGTDDLAALSFVPPPDDARLAMRAGGMDKSVSQRGAAANDGSPFKDVTERGGVPLSTDRTPWAGRPESVKRRRLERIRELEERVREEKKKATKASLDELMALVEDSQRSGSVVVYYRMSECTDINARCRGKVCRKETAPPHLFLPIYTSNSAYVDARACACAHAIWLAWVRGARAHRLHMLCCARHIKMVQAAERSAVFLNP